MGGKSNSHGSWAPAYFISHASDDLRSKEPDDAERVRLFHSIVHCLELHLAAHDPPIGIWVDRGYEISSRLRESHKRLNFAQAWRRQVREAIAETAVILFWSAQVARRFKSQLDASLWTMDSIRAARAKGSSSLPKECSVPWEAMHGVLGAGLFVIRIDATPESEGPQWLWEGHSINLSDFDANQPMNARFETLLTDLQRPHKRDAIDDSVDEPLAITYRVDRHEQREICTNGMRADETPILMVSGADSDHTGFLSHVVRAELAPAIYAGALASQSKWITLPTPAKRVTWLPDAGESEHRFTAFSQRLDDQMLRAIPGEGATWPERLAVRGPPLIVRAALSARQFLDFAERDGVAFTQRYYSTYHGVFAQPIIMAIELNLPDDRSQWGPAERRALALVETLRRRRRTPSAGARILVLPPFADIDVEDARQWALDGAVLAGLSEHNGVLCRERISQLFAARKSVAMRQWSHEATRMLRALQYVEDAV